MFKFISFVLVIVFMMVLGSVNLLAVEANDAETHYFRGVEYFMRKQYHLATLEFGAERSEAAKRLFRALKLNPNYAEAQSSFKVAYAKMKKSDSDEDGSGFADSYHGCVSFLSDPIGRSTLAGFLIAGVVVGLDAIPRDDLSTSEKCLRIVGAGIVGAMVVGVASCLRGFGV